MVFSIAYGRTTKQIKALVKIIACGIGKREPGSLMDGSDVS